MQGRGHNLLVEATTSEVVSDDDVSDCIEDELYVLGVGGTRHVTVDLLRRRLVLRLKLKKQYNVL